MYRFWYLMEIWLLECVSDLRISMAFYGLLIEFNYLNSIWNSLLMNEVWFTLITSQSAYANLVILWLQSGKFIAMKWKSCMDERCYTGSRYCVIEKDSILQRRMNDVNTLDAKIFSQWFSDWATEKTTIQCTWCGSAGKFACSLHFHLFGLKIIFE